jgi:hypothetical protein
MSRPVKVTYGPFPVSMPVLEVEPGDEWTSDSDTVIVRQVEHLHANGGEPARVRVHGVIVRGIGRGTKVRTWSFVTEQHLQIVRRTR